MTADRAIVDASVVIRWFVSQPGHEAAANWLRRLALDGDLLWAPDLLRFEVFGAFARLQPRHDKGWAAAAFGRFERLGLVMRPTGNSLFERALVLSRELGIAGYDAIYLAHAEDTDREWLTADEKAARQLAGHPRVKLLTAGTSSQAQ
jgi:predicted nucleic acid-binding protein